MGTYVLHGKTVGERCFTPIDDQQNGFVHSARCRIVDPPCPMTYLDIFFQVKDTRQSTKLLYSAQVRQRKAVQQRISRTLIPKRHFEILSECRRLRTTSATGTATWCACPGGATRTTTAATRCATRPASTATAPSQTPASARLAGWDRTARSASASPGNVSTFPHHKNSKTFSGTYLQVPQRQLLAPVRVQLFPWVPGALLRQA